MGMMGKFELKKKKKKRGDFAGLKNEIKPDYFS